MIGFAARTLLLGRVRQMSPARVARIQQRRLRALVRRAVERAPLFREKYRGIDLERFVLADLPPSNKAELMADFDRAVTDPAVRRAELERFVDDPANEGRFFLNRFAASHTSGSQGQPMLMVQDRRTLELFFSLQMTRGNVARATVGEALRRITRPARLAVVTLKRGFYPSASAFEYMPAVARRFVEVLRLAHTEPDVVARLNSFRPTALTAYAAVLDELSLEAEAGRLRLAPELRQVTNNSEMLSERARDRIARAFGVPVLNNYASGECLFLSNGCPRDLGAHVNADWAILEVVDEQYRPVPAGTPGRKVLITNLANTVQPFLRYEIGDIVTMAAAPCGCGSLLPRVERIDGRTADTFWVEDGRRYRQVISSVFKNAFDYTREVREWQAVQTGRNRVAVLLELLPGAKLDGPHARAALDRQLELYGFRGVLEVSLEVVPRLVSDVATGKFRRIVSLVGPPADLEQKRAAPLDRDAGPGQGPRAHRPVSATSPAGRRTSGPAR